MTYTEMVVNSTMRALIRIVCRIDRRGLNGIPRGGPGILATNHTTNLEGPIYYVLLDPRKKTAFGKIELWSNPFTRFLMQLWGVIPLRRGIVDRKAMERAVQAIDREHFVGIAPEGTRSKSGRLTRGRPGAALLSVRRRVPIYPIVQWGLTDVLRNLKRFRRTTVHIRVGTPFYLVPPIGREVTPKDLRAMTDEMMYQLAKLLPERLRGYYRDLSMMTENYIEAVAHKKETGYGR